MGRERLLKKEEKSGEGAPDIMTIRRLRRVPCKLNNVKERKHQTERLRKELRRAPEVRVESITGLRAK